MNQKKDFIIIHMHESTIPYLYILFWHSNGTHKIISMKETIVSIICKYSAVLIIQLY